MLVMTARDAKNHFGEALDTVQREPVLITRNNKPVSVMVSLEDIKGTYLADLFAEKAEGHDEWVQAKVSEAISKAKNGEQGTPKDQVHAQIMDKVRQRLAVKKQVLCTV